MSRRTTLWRTPEQDVRPGPLAKQECEAQRWWLAAANLRMVKRRGALSRQDGEGHQGGCDLWRIIGPHRGVTAPSPEGWGRVYIRRDTKISSNERRYRKYRLVRERSRSAKR